MHSWQLHTSQNFTKRSKVIITAQTYRKIRTQNLANKSSCSIKLIAPAFAACAKCSIVNNSSPLHLQLDVQVVSSKVYEGVLGPDTVV